MANMGGRTADARSALKCPHGPLKWGGRFKWWMRAWSGLAATLVPVVLIGTAAQHWSSLPYIVRAELPASIGMLEREEFAAQVLRMLDKLGAQEVELKIVDSTEPLSSEYPNSCPGSFVVVGFRMARSHVSELFTALQAPGETFGAYICGWEYTINLELAEAFLVSIGAGVPFVGLTILVLLAHRARQGRRWLAGILPKTASALTVGCMVGIFAFFFLWLLELLAAALGAPSPSAPAFRAGDLHQVLWAALAIVVFSPLVEEYAFRSRFLDCARRAGSPAAALVVSALLFAIFHLPATPLSFVFLLIAGLILGLLWLRTRSLLACWSAHASHNALSLTLSVVLTA